MAPLLPQQSVYGWSHPYITEDDVHIVLYTLRDYDSHAINSRKGSNACRSITYYDRILHFLSNRSRSSLFLSLWGIYGFYSPTTSCLLHLLYTAGVRTKSNSSMNMVSDSFSFVDPQETLFAWATLTGQEQRRVIVLAKFFV